MLTTARVQILWYQKYFPNNEIRYVLVRASSFFYWTICILLLYKCNEQELEMKRLKNQRHYSCFICLHQMSCLKVVELKASQEHQARTLFLLLKLVQSDSELFSQFVSQDCHKLLLRVLQSPRCIAGHHMLKVRKHYFMNGVSVSLFLQANVGIVRHWNTGCENLLSTSYPPPLFTSPPDITIISQTGTKHLLHISEGPGSNLRPETGYPDWWFSCLSSVPPGRCQDITLG
jgi:hypothetical protein